MLNDCLIYIIQGTNHHYDLTTQNFNIQRTIQLFKETEMAHQVTMNKNITGKGTRNKFHKRREREL